MPAEWEPHRATWIAWPHHEPDWPGKLAAIPWVYAEIVRILASHEQVEILCHDEGVLGDAQTALDAHGVPASRVRYAACGSGTSVRMATSGGQLILIGTYTVPTPRLTNIVV